MFREKPTQDIRFEKVGQLTEEVRALRRERKKISTYEAIGLILDKKNIKNFADRNYYFAEIGSALGKLGSEAKARKKRIKQEQEQKEQKIIHARRTQKMIKDAERVQWNEERRAGQTYQESDFE